MSPTYESESHTDWGQWPEKAHQGMSASQGELGWGVEGVRGQGGMGLPWPHLSGHGDGLAFAPGSRRPLAGFEEGGWG